jgi:hypothetical protein
MTPCQGRGWISCLPPAPRAPILYAYLAHVYTRLLKYLATM